MRVVIPFTNVRTGEVRTVKVGWSWTLFGFATTLGIPFFVRRLYLWGAAFASVWLVYVLLNGLAAPYQKVMLFIGVFLLNIWMGIKGNEITAKHYLAQGFQFTHPDSEMVKYAKYKWHMLEPYHDFCAPPAAERKYPTFD